MINGNFLLNKPIKFYNICQVYSPTINQYYDEPMVLQFYSILTTDQELLNNRFKDQQHVPTPLEYIIDRYFDNEEFKLMIMHAFEFYIHDQILPLKKSCAILIGDPNEAINSLSPRLLTNENFFDFQNMIRAAMGHDTLENIDKYEDMDPRLRQMKLKRQEAKKVKAKQAQKNGEGATLEQNLVAIFLMGIGITPLNIGEITYATIMYIIHGYQEKESYDTHMRIMTSGFGSKKQKTPKYWMTQI